MVPHLTKTNLAGDINSLNLLAKKDHKISLFTNFAGIRTSIRTFMNIKKFHFYIRGLLFKFVDFLYSRPEVFDRVIKVISSENIFFSLSFDV